MNLARVDDLLGPVFKWRHPELGQASHHDDDFWSGALTGTGRYQAAPFPPHLKLEMTQDHFDRWRDLWIPARAKTSARNLCAPSRFGRRTYVPLLGPRFRPDEIADEETEAAK